MIIKNLMGMIKYAMSNSFQSVKSVYGEMCDVQFSGTFNKNAPNVNVVDYADLTNGVRFLFGSDNTPVTIDDYKLGELVTNYIGVAMNHTTFSDYGVNVFHVTRTIKNTSESPITIKEMGIFGMYSNKIFMLAREVLPEPVTIEPGKMHDFAMIINLEV